MIDTLMLRDEAQKQSAQIKTVESGVEYLNKVKAIETWAKAQKKDAILQNAIAEQKIRTQKILGGLLKDNIQHQGGRNKTVTNNDRLSLKDIGVTKNESSTFQKIASMPEELFEQEIAQAKDESNKRIELTTSRLLKAAKQYEKDKHKEEKSKIVNDLNNTNAKNIEAEIEKGWYKVGNQFLYYGSNLDIEFKSRLPKAKFAFADPPYNAGVDEWDFDFKWELDFLQDFAEIVAVTPGGWNACNFYKQTNMNYIWEMFCWISNGMTHGKCGYANVIKTSIFGNVKPKISQDFWKISIKINESEDTKHKGRKPYDFMIHLIDIFTKEKDIVIDPFSGSGTTLLMCEKMNRISYNAELNKQYCIDIIKRIGNYERL